MKTYIWNGLIAFVLLAIAWPCVGDGVQRERLADGWEFMRADGSASETNSAAWRVVRVPHDWGVEKSFDPKKPYGDAYLEPTGIGWYRRTFRLDPARAAFIKAGGLLFFESNGVCLHHDLGVLGAAYNRAAMKRRFLRLKEAGVNAIRCSHNPDASRPSCARKPMRQKQSPSRLHLLDSCASRPHCIGRWKTLIFTFHTLALDGAEKRA